MLRRLLLMVAFGCMPVLGQGQNSTVSGQIHDPSGNPVPSVRVSLRRVDGGNNSAGAVTNIDGFFSMNVPPGRYALFAGAFMGTILPGTADASPAVVYSQSTPIFTQLGNGTFYPGTTDASQAGVITVTPGAPNQNLNFTLAASASWTPPLFQVVQGRFVIEGGGTPTMRSDQLHLFFSDGPGNRAIDVTFKDGLGKPAGTLTRLDTSQRFETVTSLVPMPAFPNGSFRIFVVDGLYRVIQPAPPASSNPSHFQQTGYYIKAMSFGTVDLMKELMRVQGPVANELVITLAKCTDSTRDALCD